MCSQSEASELSSPLNYKYQVGELVIVNERARYTNPSLIGTIAKVIVRGTLPSFNLMLYRLEGYDCYLEETQLDPAFTI